SWILTPIDLSRVKEFANNLIDVTPEQREKVEKLAEMKFRAQICRRHVKVQQAKPSARKQKLHMKLSLEKKDHRC
ncbi:hypothetical protein PMAYCL1PPCAC_27840, partial [Pristionchus mayeri]